MFSQMPQARRARDEQRRAFRQADARDRGRIERLDLPCFENALYQLSGSRLHYSHRAHTAGGTLILALIWPPKQAQRERLRLLSPAALT